MIVSVSVKKHRNDVVPISSYRPCTGGCLQSDIVELLKQRALGSPLLDFEYNSS